MAGQEQSYHSYLLRLWRDGADEPWRASLEDTRTGERTCFATVEQLMNTLSIAVRTASPSEKRLSLTQTQLETNRISED